MTKKVRIENADIADYKVVVQVWDKGGLKPGFEAGCSPDGYEPDTMAFERELAYPTAMTGDDIYLTSTRYLVVKEA